MLVHVRLPPEHVVAAMVRAINPDRTLELYGMCCEVCYVDIAAAATLTPIARCCTQLENGSTAGSIETTVAQKRAYAARSLAFNVKHPLFCDLFPEAVDVYRKQYEAAVGGAGSSEGAAGGASGGSGTAAGDAGGAEGAQGGARRRGKPAVDAGGAVGATGTPPAGEPPKPGTTSAGVIVLAIGVGLLLVSVALHWWRKGASSEA